MTGGKGTGIGNRICPPPCCWPAAMARSAPWHGPFARASPRRCRHHLPPPGRGRSACPRWPAWAWPARAASAPPHPAIIPAPSDPPRSCAALRFKAAPNAITAFQCRAATGCFVPIPSIAPIAIPETRRRPLRVAGTKGGDRLLYFQRLAYDYAQRGWLLREDCSTAS